MLIAAQVGIAGSTVVEDRVTMGGQVGVVGHVTIGRGAVVTAQSGVTNSVDAGTFLTWLPGHPEPRVAEGVDGVQEAA